MPGSPAPILSAPEPGAPPGPAFPRQRLLVIDFGEISNALDKGGLLGNLGLAVWRPTVPAVIDRLVPGSPAEQAGLLPGDRVVAVDAMAVEIFHTRSEIGVAGPYRRLRALIGEDMSAVVARFDMGQVGARLQRSARQPRDDRIRPSATPRPH